MLRRLLAGLAVPAMLAAPHGCTREGTRVDTSCASDADCVAIDTCCEGCFAANRGVVLDPCDANCIDDPCMTRYGVGLDELEAFCAEGSCDLRLVAE